MEKNRGLGLASDSLTPHQAERLSFMAAIVREVSDTPMILKGGTALLLAHGLDRYSEDLDFDCTVSITLDAKLKRAASKAGVKITDTRLKKNTETTKRYMVEFAGKHGTSAIKIETSLRADSIDPKTVVNVDGMNVYNVRTIIDQKLQCTEGRSKVRDLYDLDFLARAHPDQFTKPQAQALAQLTANPDLIHSRYAADHQGDSLLGSKPLDELALSISVRAGELAAAMSTDVKANPVEGLYNSAFTATLEAKQHQVARLADKLENILERQQGQLTVLQENPPGRLARPATRNAWTQQNDRLQSRVKSLQRRLDTVREIGEGMGLYGPKLDELAHKKVRHEQPELSREWDVYRSEQRKAAMAEKVSTQSASKGRSRGLSRD